MKFLKNNKGIVMAIIVFLLAIGAYKLFMTNSDITESSLSAENIGADIIELNASIERVNLDPALFASSAYRRLVDFSVTIPSQPIGRPNPFDLLGR
jgi:hypothetical protein